MKKKKRKPFVKEVTEEIMRTPKREKPSKQVISTGSTLLDLACYGGRVKGGGIPPGILIEIAGESSTGKSSILAEMCGYIQAKKGQARICDPEAAIDEEYAKIYGMEIDKKNYFMPDTVEELFSLAQDWNPETSDKNINIFAADSLAALSTTTEMEQGDKMGMRRAKEFSQELRKICRHIKRNNWIFLCTNQIRESQVGKVTPGGKAVAFYASIRIMMKQVDTITRTKSIKLKEGKEKKVEKIIGIKVICYIRKNKKDEPYREAPIYIVFNYGIDDIRGNLQYIKDTLGLSVYDCLGKTYRGIEKAISYIEENNLQNKLKDKVIDLWEEIQRSLKMERKPKRRI